MSGTKVNDYSISDTNIETLMLTTDQIFKGKCECTLTEMDTTTVPEIAAGSYIEVNGTLFKFDSDESISTTDPVTSSTVADGTVYIMIVPSTDTCAAAFTATAPTWSDSKQGWYGTGDYASYRYVGGCTKTSINYTGKGFLKNIPTILIPPLEIEQVLMVSKNLNKISSSTSLVKIDDDGDIMIDTHSTFSSSGTFTVPVKGIYRINCLKIDTSDGNQPWMWTFHIYKNSSSLRNIRTCTASSDSADVYGYSDQLIVIDYFDVGDVIELYAQNTGYSPPVIYSVGYYCIEMIRPL